MIPSTIKKAGTSIFILLSILYSIPTWSQDDNPRSKYAAKLHQVAESAKQYHFCVKNYDDAFSQKLFSSYLSALDKDHCVLLQKDIDGLRQYESALDNELNGFEPIFYKKASDLFVKKLKEARAICNMILSRPFKFDDNETIDLSVFKESYPKNVKEQKEKWRKWLKYQALKLLASSVKEQLKTVSANQISSLSNQQQEAAARARLKSITDNRFNRFIEKYTQENFLDLYLKQLMAVMDPHSTYLSPEETIVWNNMMSGRISGIGMKLNGEDGMYSIGDLIRGGPAESSGQLEAGDVILSVQQENEAPQIIDGLDMEDVLNMITGMEGTPVTIVCRKSNGTEKSVTIIRKKIIDVESLAKSLIIEKDSTRIGYILLPMFYGGGGSSCADDVYNEINKLKNEGVKAILLDLRYNGGGSMNDCISIVGNFVPSGTVVQLLSKNGEILKLGNSGNKAHFNAPLVVMVNEFSASASELFSSAIQDYARGIIIGAPTLGKATTQTMAFLPDMNNAANILGSLTYTNGKYYRITGRSLQLTGITPDIVLPDYRVNIHKEKDLPFAFPNDIITPTSFTTWSNRAAIDGVKKDINTWIQKNEVFQKLQQNKNNLQKANYPIQPLQWKKYAESIQTQNAAVNSSNKLMELNPQLAISILPEDKESLNADPIKEKDWNKWANTLSKDLFLGVAVKAALLMIQKAK